MTSHAGREGRTVKGGGGVREPAGGEVARGGRCQQEDVMSGLAGIIAAEIDTFAGRGVTRRA